MQTKIHTALTASQCRDRLAAMVDDDGVTSLFGAFGSRGVMGRVDEAGFRLRRRIRYRNSFQTYLTGRFIPDGHGTTIQLEAGMHKAVVALMSIWMAGAVIGGVGLGIAAIGFLFKSGFLEALPLFFGSLGIPGFGVGLVTFGRWLARDEESELAEFVVALLEES